MSKYSKIIIVSTIALFAFFITHDRALAYDGTCTHLQSDTSAQNCSGPLNNAPSGYYYSSASLEVDLELYGSEDDEEAFGYVTMCNSNNCVNIMWTQPKINISPTYHYGPVTLPGNTSANTLDSFAVLGAGAPSQTVTWTISKSVSCIISGGCVAPPPGPTPPPPPPPPPPTSMGMYCDTGDGWQSSCNAVVGQSYIIGAYTPPGSWLNEVQANNQLGGFNGLCKEDWGSPCNFGQTDFYNRFADTYVAGYGAYIDYPGTWYDAPLGAFIGTGNVRVTQSAPPTVNPPSNLTLNNSTCGHIILNWTDNSAGEAGFRIYRGLSAGSLVLIATVGANVTTYDNIPPAQGTAYYYGVASFTNSPILESAKALPTPPSVMNLNCAANLISSSKIISRVNGVGFNADSTITTGNTVTFQINLHNSGPGSATFAGNVCDTPSSNFTIGNSFSVTGGGSGSSISHPSSGNCAGVSKINLNGTLSAGETWTINYDAVFNSTGSGVLELCSNSVVLNYTDSASSSRTVRFGPTLCNKGNSSSPSFQEVAP